MYHISGTISGIHDPRSEVSWEDLRGPRMASGSLKSPTRTFSSPSLPRPMWRGDWSCRIMARSSCGHMSAKARRMVFIKEVIKYSAQNRIYNQLIPTVKKQPMKWVLGKWYMSQPMTSRVYKIMCRSLRTSGSKLTRTSRQVQGLNIPGWHPAKNAVATVGVQYTTIYRNINGEDDTCLNKKMDLSAQMFNQSWSTLHKNKLQKSATLLLDRRIQCHQAHHHVLW